jgi:hypothetical protein
VPLRKYITSRHTQAPARVSTPWNPRAVGPQARATLRAAPMRSSGAGTPRTPRRPRPVSASLFPLFSASAVPPHPASRVSSRIGSPRSCTSAASAVPQPGQ